MYHTVRGDFYWPRMADNAYPVTENYNECRKRGIRCKPQIMLKLLPSTGSFEIIAIDILCLLPKIEQGERSATVMRDPYRRLTRSVSCSRTSATHVVKLLSDRLTASYEIPSYPLSDIRLQFVSELFQSAGGFLAIKQLTKTSYHPQTNSQV